MWWKLHGNTTAPLAYTCHKAGLTSLATKPDIHHLAHYKKRLPTRFAPKSHSLHKLLRKHVNK